MTTIKTQDGTELYYKDWGSGRPVVFSHGSRRVRRAALISAIPPLMLKTENNPEGTPLSVFDGLRAAVRRSS